jgi:aspartate kinase
MKVCKFGGTSLADAGQILKVLEIAKADSDRRIIVVSAPGKRCKDDTKMTDMLIACANAMLERGDAEKEISAVVGRFAEIAEALSVPQQLSDEIEADLRLRLALDRTNAAAFTDCLKAAGEDNCAKLVAQAFAVKGLDAHYVNPREAGMLLSPEPGNAQVLDEAYARLATLRDRPGITIFPGFFGYTKDGDCVTFPRGGSDITEGDHPADLSRNARTGLCRLRRLSRRGHRARGQGGRSDLHQEHESADGPGHHDRA